MAENTPRSDLRTPTIIVGGKPYSAKTKIKQSDHAPNKIEKSLDNQAGVIHTSESRKVKASNSVRSSFETNATPKSSVRAQAPQIKPVVISQNINLTSANEEESKTTNKNNVIASKTPARNTSISTAYYLNTSYSKNSSKLDPLTEQRFEKAAELRVHQKSLIGGYTPRNIAKSAELEAKASFYEALAKYSHGKISVSKNLKNTLSVGGRAVVGKVQNAFANSDDMGNQTASGVISAAMLTHAYFKTVERAAPSVVSAAKNLPEKAEKVTNTITKVGKGVYEVYNTTGKTYITIKNSASALRSGFVPFKNALLKNAVLSGLNQTAISKRVLTIANKVTSVVKTAKQNIKTVKQTVKRSYNVVRGVANGTLKGGTVAKQVVNKAKSLRKISLSKLKIMGAKTISVSAKGVARGAVKGAVWSVKRGVPLAKKGINNASLGVASVLNRSDDMMLQGAGHVMTFTRYGVKTTVGTAKLTAKAVKTSVKAGVKTTNAITKTVSFARQKGLRAAARKAGEKVARAVQNAGKSAISAILDATKKLASKFMIPVLGIALVVCLFTVLTGGVTAVVGYFLSGEFLLADDDVLTATNIRDFLKNDEYGIETQRANEIRDKASFIEWWYLAPLDEHDMFHNGTYHIVWYKILENDDTVELGYDHNENVNKIEHVFYSAEDLLDIMSPIMYAVILVEYDLEADEDELVESLEEIFKVIWDVETETSVEYCEAITHEYCSIEHTRDDCLNPIITYHETFTCSRCCTLCQGHYCEADRCLHVHNAGCDVVGCRHQCGLNKVVLSACPECFNCSGSAICGGHNKLIYTTTLQDIEYFTDNYFEEAISELEEIENRTPEEEGRLSTLKDYYEFCKEYIKYTESLLFD